MSVRFVLPTLWLSLSGCVQPMGLGPDLGDCADLPSGAFTFGEVGIGTCLASPSDLQFAEIDGQTWLVVANSDSYDNFDSGSLLVIDWSTVDTAVEVQRMSQVSAAATTLPRDAFTGETDVSDRYLGAIGLVQDRPDGVPLALIPSRFSGDTITLDATDYLRVVDLSDPTAPAPATALGDGVELGGDPSQIAVTPGRAYVSNLFDQNLMVVDTHADPVQRLEVGRGARLSDDRFIDLDDSGSAAALVSSTIVDSSLMIDDRWTLDYIDASWRVWVPQDGLQRWEIGESAVVPALTGPDIETSQAGDTITGAYAARATDGSPLLFFGSGGNLLEAQVDQTTFEIDQWVINPSVLLRGGTSTDAWNAWVDAPSLSSSPSSTDTFMAYDGRTAPGQPASIGIAVSDTDAETGSVFVKGADPVLVPPDGLSYEDPMLRRDVFTGGLRLWLSEHDGSGGWRILESRSGDGASWVEPVAVTGLPETVSGPVVDWVNGRYIAWYSQWNGDGWSLGRAESDDGLAWERPQLVGAIPDAEDPLVPPRTAVLTSAIGGFTTTGDDAGRAGSFVTDGTTATALLSTHGFVFELSTGFAAQGIDLDRDLAGQGVDPGAHLELDGQDALYATLTGSDGRRRLGLLDPDGDGWTLRGDALLDLDELGLTETFEPVVSGTTGDYTLWFATPDSEGRPVVRRATSTDGETWTLADGVAFASEAEFAADGVLPGSIQVLENGDLRLWFTGFVREQPRIGTALSTDGGATFIDEPGAVEPWQLGPGVAGSFDDAGVRDPRIFTYEGQTWMAYAGNDGDIWRLGLARLTGTGDDPGPWDRRRDLTGAVAAWLPAVTGTFCAAGHDHPVVVPTDDGALRVWFAGQAQTSGRLSRLGSARGDSDALFAEINHPTAGDELTFSTTADGGSQGEIALRQQLDNLVTSGARISRIRYDDERGRLYLTSSSSSDLLVVDVRSDSDRGYIDRNVDDIEALLRVSQSSSGQGLRDALPIPGTDLIYAPTGTPDSVLVLDASPVEDDNLKQPYDDVLRGALALRTAVDDAGTDGIANVGGGGVALRDAGGRRHLFVPHFRDNSVTVFDLDRGLYGEAVAYLPHIGENPHVARLSPDGKHVVVANYLGDVEDGFVSSTLTVIDADPDSPTFLTVLTTLVNR